METDKRYFMEGLFIIGFAIAAAFFAVAITFSLIKLQKHRPALAWPPPIGYSSPENLASAGMAEVAPVR